LFKSVCHIADCSSPEEKNVDFPFFIYFEFLSKRKNRNAFSFVPKVLKVFWCVFFRKSL